MQVLDVHGVIAGLGQDLEDEGRGASVRRLLEVDLAAVEDSIIETYPDLSGGDLQRLAQVRPAHVTDHRGKGVGIVVDGEPRRGAEF